MEKEDLLKHLQKRYKAEWLDGDFDLVASKCNVHPSTVRRLLESDKTFIELKTRDQRNIVKSYLNILNDRLREIERDRKALIIK